MATSTKTLTTSVADNAAFQAFCTGFKAGIIDVGLVQTSDTGQMNEATVARASTGNTNQGFHIFRFDDSLQSTNPVFIRVDYGSGTATATAAVVMQVGTGTNGAGVLTGQVGTQWTSFRAWVAKTNQTWYFSSDQKQTLTIAAGIGTAASENNVLVNIERLRDSSGAAVGDAGISTLFSHSASSTVNSSQLQVIPNSGPIVATPATQAMWPGISQSMAYNQNVYFANHFPQSAYGQLHEPTIGLLKYWASDFVTGSEVSVGVYGNNATYKCLGAVYSASAASSLYMFNPFSGSGNYSANQGIAIRWQ